MDEPKPNRRRSGYRKTPDLRYLRTSLQKRFHEHTAEEVEDAIRQALENIAPSTARTPLLRELLKILGGDGKGNAGG